MTYSGDRIIFDADSHVMETREWLDPYLDDDLRQKLVPVHGREPGRVDAIVSEARARKTDVHAETKAFENPVAGPKSWMAAGAFDPAERKRVLDLLGFSGQLVFATASLVPALSATDEGVLYAGARAHNEAMAAFCKDDSRLFGVAYAPLDSPRRALEEINLALRAGNRAIMVSAGPAGPRSPGHPDLDPVWARLVETNTPFMLHIGPGTQTQPQAFRNNGRERAPSLFDGDEDLRFADYLVLSFAPQIWLAAMLYDGVFERFPALRGGVIESGAGWVPEFLRELDIGHRTFGKKDPYLKAMQMKPSEQIRRAVRFTPFPGEDVGRMIRDGCGDVLMFSSDYPHPEGTNDPKGRFERSMLDVDECDRDLFYRRNFMEMMALPVQAA